MLKYKGAGLCCHAGPAPDGNPPHAGSQVVASEPGHPCRASPSQQGRGRARMPCPRPTWKCAHRPAPCRCGAHPVRRDLVPEELDHRLRRYGPSRCGHLQHGRLRRAAAGRRRRRGRAGPALGRQRRWRRRHCARASLHRRRRWRRRGRACAPRNCWRRRRGRRWRRRSRRPGRCRKCAGTWRRRRRRRRWRRRRSLSFFGHALARGPRAGGGIGRAGGRVCCSAAGLAPRACRQPQTRRLPQCGRLLARACRPAAAARPQVGLGPRGQRRRYAQPRDVVRARPGRVQVADKRDAQAAQHGRPLAEPEHVLQLRAAAHLPRPRPVSRLSAAHGEQLCAWASNPAILDKSQSLVSLHDGASPPGLMHPYTKCVTSAGPWQRMSASPSRASGAARGAGRGAARLQADLAQRLERMDWRGRVREARERRSARLVRECDLRRAALVTPEEMARRAPAPCAHVFELRRSQWLPQQRGMPPQAWQAGREGRCGAWSGAAAGAGARLDGDARLRALPQLHRAGALHARAEAPARARAAWGRGRAKCPPRVCQHRRAPPAARTAWSSTAAARRRRRAPGPARARSCCRSRRPARPRRRRRRAPESSSRCCRRTPARRRGRRGRASTTRPWPACWTQDRGRGLAESTPLPPAAPQRDRSRQRPGRQTLRQAHSCPRSPPRAARAPAAWPSPRAAGATPAGPPGAARARAAGGLATQCQAPGAMPPAPPRAEAPGRTAHTRCLG